MKRPTEPTVRPPPRLAPPWNWAVPLAVFAVAFCAFGPALRAEFVNYDDPIILTALTEHAGFGAEQLRWMFSTTLAGHYQPLTWLSLAIDHAMAGLAPRPSPRPFHLTNMLLHAANGVLVYLIAARLLNAAWSGGAADRAAPPRALHLAAAGAALLFAVHPLRAESVAWVTERRDVLSGFFLLLTLLAYLRAFPPGSVRPASYGWYAASVALLLLSLLSKAWGMSFFVVAVVADWYPLRRLPQNPLRWAELATIPVWIQKLPYAALGITFALVAAYAQSSMPLTARSLEDWGVGERAVQACYGLMFYLWKTVWPFGLAALYELPADLDPSAPRYIAAYAVVAAAAVAAVALWRRRPAVPAACIVYAVLLAPILGTFQSGDQFVADRYSYLACIVWPLLGAGGVLLLLSRRPRLFAASAAAAAVLVAAMFVLTWRQAAVWRDTLTLWSHAVERAGVEGPLLRTFYGNELENHGRRDEAIRQYRRAIELDPTNGWVIFTLANAVRESGDLAQAERLYLQAAPLMDSPWMAHTKLGIMYITEMGRTEDAIAAFERAVRDAESGPAELFSPAPYLMLGAALGESGDEQGAVRWLRKAAEYPLTRDQAVQHLRDLGAM